MAKSEKRIIGDLGEDIAVKYLENKGFSLMERNHWRPWGEIDIVCKKENTVHFVEVKSVSREPNSGGIRPEENLHPSKLKRLHRTVQTYLMEKKLDRNVLWQIDLVCIYLEPEKKKAQVEVLENVVF